MAQMAMARRMTRIQKATSNMPEKLFPNSRMPSITCLESDCRAKMTAKTAVIKLTPKSTRVSILSVFSFITVKGLFVYK